LRVLDPHERGSLLESLRPPPGYRVDSAIATTYSLDLIALLTAPLAFSLYDRLVVSEGRAPVERLDSLALLHAVRQHAERLVVFCQAGLTVRPPAYRQLLVYLEDSVVQVKAPSENGVFHPKLWIQRFTSAGSPTRYRVLCLSRNLTFDRSWDTILVLDGELIERKLAIGDSRPLGEFIEALPGLALNTMSVARKAIVTTIAEEIRRVRFEIPAGFDAMLFWPLGHDGKRRDPFGDTRIDRLLIVSPFLAANRLELLAEQGKNHVLVSRIDELEKIPAEVLARYDDLHVLNDAAEGVDDAPDSDGAEPASMALLPPARGLHAKLYVADDGRHAHVWTGSANASDAAFGINVEFLVQLTGKKGSVGVHRTLNGEGDGGLSRLLGPFTPPKAPVVETETEKRLADILRAANRMLSTAGWIARATCTSAPDDKDMYTVVLGQHNDATLTLSDECSVRVWPIALPEDRALSFDGASSVAFERCSFLALTSFFAFEITATVGQRVDRNEFVVRVPLEGVPEDRSARLLHALLDDPAKVVRFLSLLLSLDAFEAIHLLDFDGTANAVVGAPAGRDDSVALFESLVRTLDRDPHRLVEVERLVRELKSTPGMAARLLPLNFEELWIPLWAAYQAIPQARRPS
jgi:hypothetical protein